MAIHLTHSPPLAKSLTPVCTSKGLSSSANLSTGSEENLVLSSPKTRDKHHPTLGIAISSTSRTRWDNHRASCSHMQWPSILHQHPPMVKSLAPVCTSKGLSKSANLSTGGEENLLLSSPKTWWQGSSHSWDSHFLHKPDKVRQPWSLMLS